jgi:UDP-N-acetylmuramate: L-alanyl-gamma-D-glutamyl-meso-diaminopimelate ligase
MRIHIIAMGGAVMHNLSIALHLAGYRQSDDEIYNPAKDKLESYHLLTPFGWHLTKRCRLIWSS